MRHLLLLITCFLSFQTASARIWTSQDGKTIEAEFVSLDETENPAIITLRRSDNRLFSLRLDLLSQTDQDFARALSALKPTLSIRVADEMVLISWDITHGNDLVLHYSDTLNGSWLPVALPFNDQGSTRTVTIPLRDAPQRFFRLE